MLHSWLRVGVPLSSQREGERSQGKVSVEIKKRSLGEQSKAKLSWLISEGWTVQSLDLCQNTICNRSACTPSSEYQEFEVHAITGFGLLLLIGYLQTATFRNMTCMITWDNDDDWQDNKTKNKKKTPQHIQYVKDAGRFFGLWIHFTYKLFVQISSLFVFVFLLKGGVLVMCLCTRTCNTSVHFNTFWHLHLGNSLLEKPVQDGYSRPQFILWHFRLREYHKYEQKIQISRLKSVRGAQSTLWA